MRDGEEDLTPEAREALAAARRIPASYAIRVLKTADSPPRTLVIVGEAHMKLAHAAKVGADIVKAFDLRGVETFPVRKVFLGRALSLLIKGPRVLLRVVSLGLVKGSTIVDATALGATQLEANQPIPMGLHVGAAYWTAFFTVAFAQPLLFLFFGDSDPFGLTTYFTYAALFFQLHMPFLLPAWLLRRHSWSWVFHPAVTILTLRDILMAEGTVRMLRENPEPRAAVVVMGRAHLAGYSRILIEQHGFKRVS